MIKECKNCMWKLSTQRYPLCMNPLNDSLFDYFNSSTGNVIADVRVASRIPYEETCDYFQPMGKGNASETNTSGIESTSGSNPRKGQDKKVAQFSGKSRKVGQK